MHFPAQKTTPHSERERESKKIATMEPSNNTETEDETIALKRKRARRVSFADNEITSVHVFRRDDTSSSSSPSDDDGEVVDGRESFLRPIGTPSPGGSSTTADDGDAEDDFHGPISACFIRPERLSDSGASDDVTLDSTMFSLHYRSLARSDSGDLKTPSSFGMETPSESCSLPGSFMELTKANKQSHVPADAAASGGRDSNDMSVEGERPQSYGYDVLSPALGAILAEGSKDLSAVLPLHFKAADSPHINDMSVAAPAPDSSFKEIKEFANDATVPVPKQLGFGNANRGTPQKMDEGYQLNLSAQFELGYSKGQVTESNPKDRGQLSDSNHKSDKVNGNPIHGFTPLSFAGRKQLFIGSPDSSRYTGNITSPLKKSDLFVPEVYVTHGATLSSIRNSISKLQALDSTPSTSTLKEGIERLKCRLSKYSPGTSLFNEKDHEHKQVETLHAPVKEHLFSLTLENDIHQGLLNTDDHGIEPFRNISNLSQNEETVDTKKDEENSNLISADVSYNVKNPKPVEMTSSPSQMTHLTRVIDFDLADSADVKRKDEILIVTHDKRFSSPVKSFDQNLSPYVEGQSYCHGELKLLDKQNECVFSGIGQATECNTQAIANKLELSGFRSSEQLSSPFEVAQFNEFAKSASKRKSTESPAKRVLVLSTPIQEATTLLPSLQEPPSELLHNNMQDMSIKGNSDGHDLDNNYRLALQVAQSSLTKSGIEIPSGKKRKGVEILSGDNIDIMGRIDKSLEVHKSENSDLQLVSEQTGYMTSEREKLEDQTWNDWDHILKNFLGSTKQLLSPSVDKLNLRLIGMLEDTLVHRQKVKKCEIICSEIQSQEIMDLVSIPRHKRVVETRMLLFKIAYEKAKLQLMHMKHERLLKKVQSLSTCLEEAQMKLNFIPCSSKSGAIDTHVDDSYIRNNLFNSQGKCQVSGKKVMEMRQELETLDGKAKSSSEFLYSYCKMVGDRSFSDTIKSVADYLQKRMSRQFIFQNLKLWDIDDFEHKDGCYRVLLNYCGYIIQRFTVNAGLSSVRISNNLNDVNIVKTFPEMDAFSAFEFVFNSYTTKQFTGSITMAQETQITSSLLSNLLDVIEEVQLARIEIRNLVQAKFYPHSVQQLRLQLSFVDFSSGRKVEVTLDMTSLKCGAYPVDLLPSQIYDPARGEQQPLPSSLVDEIRTAVESVKVGYSRIIRLCRRISQVVQACTQRS
ncbi:uncharacterized protein LOC133284162 [Gastrolobium bilobum]|uniref:uncharacterized protein LOC133284162 n=1 Tax=Gastrolobium bilobum TaxID=150636 RepID=UPI002AB091AB|nr:uncharacterized protein LOC133284162 [Gastrolobium bilobum]